MPWLDTQHGRCMMEKDRILDALAAHANVAQFVAYRPGADGAPVQSHSRISGHMANATFATIEDAVAALLAASGSKTVNIRSYAPDSPRSREFLYGLDDFDMVRRELVRLSGEGLHTIVNETIDVSDGGVSGVVHGGTIEFAPDDTPRCVERPGVASMPTALAVAMFEIVYGFRPEFADAADRLEFSLHPERQGTRGEHVLFWEREAGAPPPSKPTLVWPNHFSRHLGDKAFGLLVAHLLGLPVPETLVISRRVAPFRFGRETRTHEHWLRTCPAEPMPGHFTTTRRWVDPFDLLAREDPDGTQIASVLSQAAVPARFSGATIAGPGGLIAEGRAGEGDGYMLGAEPPEPLPADVLADIETAYTSLAARLGPVRFEWVHDGNELWLVQLHLGATGTAGKTIVPGEPVNWVEFDTTKGLEALRTLVESLARDSGIRLMGQVGATSHFADVVRRAGVPTELG